MNWPTAHTHKRLLPGAAARGPRGQPRYNGSTSYRLLASPIATARDCYAYVLYACAAGSHAPRMGRRNRPQSPRQSHDSRVHALHALRELFRSELSNPHFSAAGSRHDPTMTTAPSRPRFAKKKMLRPPTAPACGSGLVIDLDSPLISQWDIVTVYALFFTALVTPYEIGFVDLSIDPLFWINRLVDTVFLADIVLNFFISYTDENGDAVKDLRRIGKRYLGTWFCIDIGRCRRVFVGGPRVARLP